MLMIKPTFIINIDGPPTGNCLIILNQLCDSVTALLLDFLEVFPYLGDGIIKVARYSWVIRIYCIAIQKIAQCRGC